MSHYDVLIVGAGPAGIAASIELAKAHWNVLLIEKSAFPRNKVCGGFIGPENKPILHQYGILDQMMNEGAQKVTHIHLSAPNGLDVQVPLRFHGKDDCGLGFSRQRMDELLVEKAKACGVRFMDQSVLQTHRNTDQKDVYLINDLRNNRKVEVQASIQINAFGAQHKASKASGRVFGVSGIFDKYEQMASDVTMHFVDQGHVGINHFEKKRVNVCYVVKENLFKKWKGNYEALWKMFLSSNPLVRWQFKKSNLISPWKGTFVDLNRPLQFFDGRSFYLGDAMGIIHPVAGGGISLAFNSGVLLASLLAKTVAKDVFFRDIALEYERTWRKNYYRPMVISKYIGQAAHHACCANTIIRFLKWREENIHQLFDSFHKPISFHTRSMSYETH